MGRIKRDILGKELKIFAEYDYNNIDKIEKALKNYLKMKCKAEDGNTAYNIISLDMKTALGLSKKDNIMTILTKKQREAIVACLLLGYTEKEFAKKKGITQEAVSVRITGGIKRIRKYLLNEKFNWSEWEDEEIEFICNNYYKMSPGIIANEIGKSKGAVISKAHRLRNKNLLWNKEQVKLLKKLYLSGMNIEDIEKELKDKPLYLIESMITKLIAERKL